VERVGVRGENVRKQFSDLPCKHLEKGGIGHENFLKEDHG
jgi:hypothetical protein